MKSWIVFVLMAIGAIGSLATSQAAPPTVEIRPAGKRVKLNNLVTELVQTKFPQCGRAEFLFENPRDGWVFFSVPAEAAASGKVVVSLGRTPREETILSRTMGRHGEAMRWLPAGNHQLQVRADGKPDGALVVRTMPEIILTAFQGDFHSPDGSPYKKPSKTQVPGEDRLFLYCWDFLDRYVLDNVNVVQAGYQKSPEMDKWLAEGRRLILGGYFPSEKPDALYAHWSEGMNATHSSGVLVDEFVSPTLNISEADRVLGGYRAGYGFSPEILAVIRRMHADSPGRKGKFYAYLGVPWAATAKDCKPLMDVLDACGYYWAWESYLWEQPHISEANACVEKLLCQRMRDFRKETPGCEKRCVLCPSILDDWDSVPNVDYKVWLDMQMNAVARDPAFEGLYGIAPYQCRNADPEMMRWTSALYRHYCIEGHTGLLSAKYGYTLMTEHLKNADFAAGAAQWNVQPADAGSIRFKKIGDLPFKKGYLPRGPGVMTMKRSDKKANVVRQAIKNLQPGRLYSFRMFSGDPANTNLTTKQLYAHSINVNGAELVTRQCRQDVQRGDRAVPGSICWNYTYIVFKATEPTAMLEVSDWVDKKTRGGPAGQELIFDFMQVQPFFPVERQMQTGPQ
jgi:hypothetical protein